ncbi:hypothetical protein HYN56_08400 [Flavobacterium crocinum]|uniref:Uncharacterized protein n=1 Tax=Flavobacterium crocinum TaxID=2183896 RepID=A0A2S1YJJ7_9FLAO|nr:hypothetical protein HYN56_08400 [Flavobacterium crocinum]
MKSDEIIKVLESYNYKCILNNNIIKVKLDFSQNVIIDLSNHNKTIIRDELVNWNFLSGSFKMSLKNSILFNFIAIIFLGFLCQSLDILDYSFNFTNLFLTYIAWVLIFTTFYLIKLESFKSQFIKLTK